MRNETGAKSTFDLKKENNAVRTNEARRSKPVARPRPAHIPRAAFVFKIPTKSFDALAHEMQSRCEKAITGI